MLPSTSPSIKSIAAPELSEVVLGMIFSVSLDFNFFRVAVESFWTYRCEASLPQGVAIISTQAAEMINISISPCLV
ncbi:hypothetical protein D3C84_1024880 [compost metagenome]